MLSARSSGKRVEDLSQRTETTQVFANPDGSWTSDEAAGPVRAKDAQGEWAEIDTDLVPVDGGIAPKNVPGDLLLSDGGDTTFASLEVDGKELGWRWPTVLPAPTIDGPTATYANVVENGDLVVTATSTGFQHDIVLREAPADPVSFPIPIVTGGPVVSDDASGSMTVETKSGDELVTATPPVMYDADTTTAGLPAETVPVDSVVTPNATGGVLTLSPDQDFLTDPGTKFPVTIDPVVTYGPTQDTWVDSGNPANGHPTSTEVWAGTPDNGAHKYRGYVSFANGSWIGKTVTSAKFTMPNLYSPACTGAAVRVYRVTGGWAAGNVTWNSQPGSTSTDSVETTVAKGFSSACPAGVVSWDITNIAKGWAAKTYGNYGVRVGATTESGTTSYRRYWSTEHGTSSYPKLVVNYNLVPSAPTVPTANPYGSYAPPGSTGPSPLYVGSVRPSFSAKATDGDGGTLTQTFEVATTAGGTPVASCSVTIASGETGTCAPPVDLNNNATYFVRARANDGIASSGWSSSLQLTIADGVPPVPVVSCPGWANNAWSATAPGGTIACTITAASPAGTNQAGWIRYTVGNGTEQRILIARSADPAVAKTTVNIPGTLGQHTITTQAESAGGSLSAPVEYGFGFGPQTTLARPDGTGGGTSDAVPAVTTNRVRLAAWGPPKEAGESIPAAHVRWRVSGSGADETSGWTNAPGSAETLTVAEGSGGLTVTGTWDATTATGDSVDPRTPALLDVQVCVDYSAGSNCSWVTSKRQVLRVPHAFGDGFPTTDVPGGQAALFTGEFNADETDATVEAGNDDLSVSRTAATFDGPPASPATGVFGPGWTASLEGPDAGFADLQVIDRTRNDGTIVAIDGEGSAMVFAPPGSGAASASKRTGANLAAGNWRPVDEDTIESGITMSVTGTGTATTITLVDLDGTTTRFATTTAPAAGVDGIFAPDEVNEPGTGGVSTYSRDGAGRVTRIIAPVPAGVTCPATGTLPAGCRAMSITYATTTTATSGTPGDIDGQVSSISSLIGPNTPVTLATYKYDADKRLVSVTDPRNNLTTAYTYDGTSKRLASITPAGLKPITYEYSGDENKLARVKRDRPGTGTGTATLATLIYGVPTKDTTGLPDLDTAAVAVWGQAAAPTYGAAVFGPDEPVESLDPAQIPAADWANASLSYTDARGYTLNTASNGAGGWQYTSTAYDALGHEVRELDEGDINAITGGEINANASGTVTIYNTDHKNTAGDVTLPAGSVVTDTYGTTRYVTLGNGTRVLARPHSKTTYDEGSPSGGIDPASGQEWTQPTTVVTDAVDPATLTPLETLSVTKTTYSDAVAGDSNAGWKLGLAGSVTQVMDPSGAPGAGDIVGRTRYDADGRVISQLQPKSNGADAGTRLTTYYTAGSNPVAACGSKPAWDGAVCQTSYAAAASSGPQLVTTTIASYNDQLQPLTTTETANGATRTTTQTYRPDGSALATTTTLSGVSGSQPVPTVTNTYDPATGLGTGSTSSGTGAADPVVIGYDTWGRQTTYSAKAGETTTTTYDNAGRIATVVDPQGTTTMTYDGTDADGKAEHRGLATKVTYSNPAGRAVEVTGAYDADGTLIRQDLPGGIIQRTTYDAAGEPLGLTYSGQVTRENPDGTTTTSQDQAWVAWSQDNDTMGRVRREWTPSGAAFDGDTGNAGSGYARDYTYDRAARLTNVIDKTAQPADGPINPDDPTASALTACTIRDYTFDTNGNRTTLKTTPAATDGTCQTGGSPTGVTTITTPYDTADRNTTTGYAYDAFGRITTLPQSATPAGQATGATPGNLSIGYYDTDAARSTTQSGVTTSYTLDTAGRRTAAATGPSGGGVATSTTINHYTDNTDNPAWTETTAGSSTTVERYAEALGGDLTLTIRGDGTVQLPIVDPHGDVVTQSTLPASGNAVGIDSWRDTDEYGNPLNGGAVGSTPTNVDEIGNAYGWLGGKERALNPTGLLLMGARLFDPVSGQFSSTDPEYGGNTTSYVYPDDPINQDDLSGEWNCKFCKHVHDRAMSTWRRQRHLFGDIYMRRGRPALHWNNHRNRLEYDKDNKWHYNIGKEHYSIRRGLREYGRHAGRRLLRKARRIGKYAWRAARIVGAIGAGLECFPSCEFMSPFTLQKRKYVPVA